MNSIKKIIEYGLYLLVFILPVQTRWIIKAGEINGGYSEYGTLSLYATDALLIILLLLFIIDLFFKKRTTSYKLQATSYWLYIILIELAIFISIFSAQDAWLAIYKYGVFLLGIGLFWLIISAEYSRIKLIWSLIAGATIQACLGIWQFLTQSTFSTKWLGMAMHKSGDLGVSVIETLNNERWLRAYGGLDHPNILGGFLAIALLFLAILCINKKFTMSLRATGEAISAEPTSRDYFTTFVITSVLFCFSVFLFALFFSFSRSAWLACLAGLIVVLVILLWQKNEKAIKDFLKLIFVGFVLVIFLFNIYSSLVLTRLSGEARLEVKSTNERVESLKYAREIIKNNWLFGVGIGNYELALRNEIKSPNPLYQGGDYPSYFYQPVHNVFLLVWAETGILGLLGFSGLFIYLVIENLKFKINNNEGKDTLDYYGISLASSLVVIMFVDHWLWSLHFGVLFLFLVFGFVLREKRV